MGGRSLSFANAVWVLCAVGVGIAAAFFHVDSLAVWLTLLSMMLGILLTPIAAVSIMLVVSPLRTLVLTEAPGLLPLDIGQIAFAVVVASWLFYRFVERRALLSTLRPTPVLWLVGSFLTASALSTFVAYSTQAWLTEWLKWIQIAMLIIIIGDVCRSYGWRWLVFALVAAAAANAIIGIYEYYGGSGAPHLLIDDSHFRAFGTFGQPNPFGGFMGLVAPIALAASVAVGIESWKTYQRLRRIDGSFLLSLFYSSAAVVISYGLYTSWSRGAWLGFAVAMAVFVLAFPRRKAVSAAIVLVGLGLSLLVIFSGRLPASIAARLATVTDELSATGDVRGVDITTENYANVERLAHWQAATNMAAAHPWLGVGFGNYEIAYPSFSLLNWRLALGHAHNYYLNVLAETGMIGALAYAAMMIGIAVLVWRLRNHPDSTARTIGIGVLSSLAYLSVHSLTDNLYVNNLFLHVGVLFALVAVLHDQLNRRRYV